DDTPEDVHGVVIAALAAGPTQGVEQLGIGQGGQQILDGLQRGAVFERPPIEQRLGGVEDHHGRGAPRWNEAVKGRYSLLRKESPRRWRRGRKIVRNQPLPDKAPKRSMVLGGTLGELQRGALIL